jgi:hypothetical protein
MKFKSILQVIFRGAYWLRFWAQLQRKEQAKDTLIAMSRKLESRCSTDCQWRTEHFLSFTLVGGMLPIAACFFKLSWSVLFNSVIIGCVHLRM